MAPAPLSLPTAVAVEVPRASRVSSPSSVSAVPHPAPSAPFIRLILNPSIPSVAVPQGFDGRVSQEEWQTFWRNLLYLTPGFGTRLLLRVMMYVFAGVYLVFATGADYLDPWSMMLMHIVLASAAALGYRSFVGYVRQRELEVLQRSCEAAEERLFRALGYTIECEFEWTEGCESSQYGFCVYFYPVPVNDDEAAPETPFVTDHFHGIVEYRSGYKRIQLINDGPKSAGGKMGACGFQLCNPVAFSYIPPSATEPPSVPESFEAFTWTEFWSAMHAVSKKVLFAHRLVWLANLAFHGGLFGLILLAIAFDVIWSQRTFLTVLFGSLVFLVVTRCHFESVMEEMRHKVHLYGAALRHVSGTILVYRSIYGFHWFHGLHHVRYLYVYRLPEQAAATPTLAQARDEEAPAIVPFMVIPEVV